jgi:hypothetical protein
LLDRLFEPAVVSNKLPQLICAVINKLSRTDPATAVIVVKALVEEALEHLPAEERDALMREFTELANSN